MWIIGVAIGLLLLVFLLIRIPAVQQFAVQKVVSYLETKIETPVRLKKVTLDLPKVLVLEGVYFEDQQGDTLISGDTLRVDISLFKLFDNTVEINELDLRGITANISRTLPDSAFNFDYIVRAFATEEVEETSSDTTAAMGFSISKINLDRIHIRYSDDIVGTEAEFRLGHFDTRIKTFDLEKMFFDIPEIAIHGVQTSLQQWEVAGAEDVPSTDDLGVEAAAGAEAGFPDVRIGEADLRDFNIHYNDQASKMDARVIFGKLFVDIRSINLPEEKIHLKKLELSDHHSSIAFGASGADSPPADTSSADSASAMNWQIQAEEILLSGNELRYDDSTQTPVSRGMDYAHMHIRPLDLDLRDLYFSMDSISGSLKSLKMHEKSGLRINRLHTDFQYTTTGVVLDDFFLETPHTLLQDQIRIHYPSLESIAEDPGSIAINANLSESYLGMEDVGLLMPELMEMPELKPIEKVTFFMDARLQGPLNALQIPEFEVRTLDQTRLAVSGRIQGLPDMDRVFADLDIKELRSTRGDLDRLIARHLLPDGAQLPQAFRLNGTFTGGMQAFKTNMHLKSTMGDADVNGAFSSRGDTSYQADLRVSGLQLGKLLGDTTLGVLSLQARVDGEGLDPRSARMQAEGALVEAYYNGYTYRDLRFNARASGGNILASLDSDDPNLALHMNAKGDMSGTYPKLTLALDADTIDLHALNFSTDPFRYHGKLQADLETADPDFLNGILLLTNSNISYKQEQYQLDTVALRAEASDSLHLINLDAEFLKAHMIGNYKLTELAAAMQDVLGTYYTPLRPDSIDSYSDQSFEFSAELIRSPLVRKLVPELTEMENVTLDGTFQSADKMLNMRLGAPHILYAGTLIDTVSLDLNSADSTLYYAGNIGTINVSNINLINTLLSGTIHDNVIDAGLWIKDSLDKEQYHIGAELFAEEADYRFHIKPDGLMLNYDQWEVDPQNAVYFGEEGILARQFNLTHEGQRLSLNSQDSVKNAPIDLSFQDFRIETFTKFIESSTLKLGGALQGDVMVDRLDTEPVFVSDLSIDGFYFGQDTIGDIYVQVDNKQANSFAANIDITGNGNDVNLRGIYHAPPEGTSNFDLVLDLRNLNMSTLEAFSFGSLRESSGSIKGKLDITGTPDNPDITGSMRFDQAATTIAMLNAHFGMDQQEIAFNSSGIRFRDFQITDSAGHQATLNGSIATETYTDYRFNLGLTARNLQVLNSTAKDNDLFYGDLFLDTDMKITGDLDNPKVNGSLKVNPKTDMTIVIPDDEPGLVEREGIVEFVDFSDTSAMRMLSAVDTISTTTVPGLDVSLNIDVDPEAAFTVVIDPGTGDALYAKGSAELTAGIDPGGNVSLAGTYEVSEGSYELSFNMINRRFDFQKGSTITWTGDPMKADLDITAVYTVEAPPIDLVEHQLSGQNSNLFKEKIPFDVNLFIQGEMMKPRLSFGIAMDEEQANVSQDVSGLVETRLTQLKEDESELNKQVFALIVLGRFVAENPFSSAAGGSVESMARESVSKLLSAQLNRLAGDLIAGVELNFDLESTDDYSTGQQQTRTDLNVGVSKRLFNDRLKVTVGSNFGLEGANQPGRQATNIAGDISIDYQLSKDGRYLLRAYRKNKYEVTLQGQVIETGLGFVISMDYNKFKELLMNARELEKYQQAEEERKEQSYRRKGRQRRVRGSKRRMNQSQGAVEFKNEGKSNEDQ